MDIKILNNSFLTIERGNPLKRQDQTIHRIMVHPGLLKCGKVEMESTIDQGNLIKILGIHWGKLTLIVENIFSAGRRILQGTKRLFTIERGDPLQRMSKERLIESAIISLDAGLRLDGIPALDLWDRIVAVLHGNTYQTNQERRDPHKSPTRKKIHGTIDDLDNVDFISSNVNSSRQEALLYIFEDNEAVIKMIIKGRSLTMRHVSRTHRVALDWLFDRINLDPKIQIIYIDTKNNSQTY